MTKTILINFFQTNGAVRNVLHSLTILADNIQLLDETEKNIVIYQWRGDQLFADAEGRGK